MNIEILYEDDYIIAINKPSGLVVHPGVKTDYTLTHWIQEKFPELEGVGEPYYTPEGNEIPRPGIVHRLDKETSGVMILAKDQDTYYVLKKHFQKRKIKKEYHAFVHGSPKRKRGTIDVKIGKSRSDFRKQTSRNMRGEAKEAVTEYVVAGTCEENTSFVRFYPLSGRTHQIRVHAVYANMPLIGDSKYASRKNNLLGFERLALHSRRLTISTHMYETPLVIVAPYPKDFKEALSTCSITSKEVE